jgi:hypothetical protein
VTCGSRVKVLSSLQSSGLHEREKNFKSRLTGRSEIRGREAGQILCDLVRVAADLAHEVQGGLLVEICLQLILEKGNVLCNP